MDPFKKRATEFIEDPIALLGLISPQPIRAFFEDSAPTFFDRLVVVVGTPGSGKTTISRLLEFTSLSALVSLAGRDREVRDLLSALAECGVLDDMRPKYLGYRLPPSSNFREIWELPYSEAVRSLLLRSFIQAKTVLGWMRQLERESFPIENIRLNAREGNEMKQRMLRFDDPLEFREHARKVEEQIYRIITALVPPSEQQLAQHLRHGRLDAFEVLETITVVRENTDAELELKPMVMIDDAHELHPRQFADVELWLRSREMKISRWIMTRIDAISADDLRKALNEQSVDSHVPGSSPGRDRVLKLIQRDRRDRSGFRHIARDISKRYIEQMPVLRRRGIRTLEDCLGTKAQPISPSQLKQVESAIARLENDLRLPSSRRQALWDSIPDKVMPDERLATFRILLHREKRKLPQRDIFGVADADFISEQEGPRIVKSAVVEGSAIQLLHQFDRPFYFGFERLADASNDNIEQFINLAGALVESIEARLLRGRDPILDAKDQHRALVERAAKTMHSWDFPHCGAVRRLIRFIAEKCVEKTLEPNASLDDGANAYGIPQAEMDRLAEKSPEMMQIIQFALAYNAILLNENYVCKGKTWCLFELGGLPVLANKLTLHRGGFCEGHVSALQDYVSAESVSQ